MFWSIIGGQLSQKFNSPRLMISWFKPFRCARCVAEWDPNTKTNKSNQTKKLWVRFKFKVETKANKKH